MYMRDGRYLTLYIIREIQSKATVKYYYRTLRMAKILNTGNTKCWQGWAATPTLTHCWWEYKTVQPRWRAVWWFLMKLNILLPYNPATMLLCIYPKELKTCILHKFCKRMFIAILFLITKTWRQPGYPSVGEWINKLWYIQKMKSYAALKRNEQPSHEKIWRKLKCILLSAISWSEKTTYGIISTIWCVGKGKTMETKRSEVTRSGGGERWIGKHRGLLGQWNILYDIIMLDLCHYTFAKPVEHAMPRVKPKINYGLWVVIVSR